MSTQTIERMAVEVEGSGDAVIMIHGLGGTSNTFTPQMSVYAGRFRVVRPDLRGSGRSPAGDAPLSIEGMAESIARAADVLGIRRAHFIGHSLGTIVCQHIAAATPSLVASLALFGPLTEPPEAARQNLKARAANARENGMADIADAIVNGATSADTRSNNPVAVALVREMVMRQPPEGYARTCEALSEARAADLSRISCPVLLVAGEDDAVAPVSMSRGMADRLEQARVITLPRCGHWMTFERPAECTTALKDFHGVARVS